MGSVNDLLKDVYIPKMVAVRQKFDREYLEDVEKAVLKELDRDEVKEKIYPEMSIAITAGSRGIDNLALVIKTVVSFLK